MADNFKAGDVVTLKSGGPKMTVNSVGKDLAQRDMVYCTWFMDNKKQSDAFPPEILKDA